LHIPNNKKAKLKIVARGNKIKAYGDEDVLEEFDRRITMLLEQYMKYNKIDENVIERVLLSRSKEDYETPEFNNKEVIVHGVSEAHYLNKACGGGWGESGFPSGRFKGKARSVYAAAVRCPSRYDTRGKAGITY